MMDINVKQPHFSDKKSAAATLNRTGINFDLIPEKHKI